MEENKYDSQYDPDGMFLLSRVNRYSDSLCLELNYKFNETLNQRFAVLGLYCSERGESMDVQYPLTKNDIDRLIAKLQEMREEIRQPEE